MNQILILDEEELVGQFYSDLDTFQFCPTSTTRVSDLVILDNIDEILYHWGFGSKTLYPGDCITFNLGNIRRANGGNYIAILNGNLWCLSNVFFINFVK